MNQIVIDINPVLVQIGPLAVRWYGLMYVVGIAVGLWVVAPYARQRGIGEEELGDVVLPAALAGLIGARLYYVAQQPLEPYLAEPWRIFATWEGGMAFYGAVFAVALTLVIYARRRGLPLWRLLDVGAIFAVVGQSFGRVGNIINGDIIGEPTNLPWGFIYRHPDSFVPDHTVAYQPAALYELLFNLTLFGLLWWLRLRLPRGGLLFAVYLMLYSLGQFFLFFLRTEPLVALGLKQAQLTALAVLVAGAILFVWLLTHRERLHNGEKGT
ncbi:MAG: prolipoprotein diacylglyceryl transferase [Chloroflexota bacterium]